MSEKWCVVINPNAGRGLAGKRLSRIKEALDLHQLPYNLLISTTIENTRRWINAALADGCRKFVSVGGDGSHHVLVNALDPSPGQDPITVGIIPVGTGNDWARQHSIPGKIPGAVALIAAGHRIPHALGRVSFLSSERSFVYINVLGTGLDGYVVERLSRTSAASLGSLAYLYHGVRGLIGYRSLETEVRAGTFALKKHLLTVHAGICRYSGGGMSFTPHADPQGHALAITCIEGISKAGLIANVYRLYNGTIGAFKRVVTLSAQSVIIKSEQEAQQAVEADGEFLGHGNIRVEIQPAAFQLVVPMVYAGTVP